MSFIILCFVVYIIGFVIYELLICALLACVSMIGYVLTVKISMKYIITI